MISLEVTKLKKSYGSKSVFTDVSLSCEGGSLGIAGSNGSGKSTFLKCLGFLQRPSKGQIIWKADNAFLEREAIKSRMGYAAPYINLYDELTCLENLQFLCEVRHEQDNLSLKKWIEKVGLAAMADQPFGKLSTGQQQRLRIASALFHEPDVLLLDEPGSNLDEAGRRLISDITATAKADGKLVILASNNPGELDLCDRIYSIEQELFL